MIVYYDPLKNFASEKIINNLIKINNFFNQLVITTTMSERILPTPKELLDKLFSRESNPEIRLTEVMTRLPFETVRDLRSFVRSANTLRRLSKGCDPEVVKEAVLLEKRKRVAIESVREDWLEKKIIPDEVAREAIDFIHSTADESIEEAYRNLEACLRR